MKRKKIFIVAIGAVAVVVITTVITMSTIFANLHNDVSDEVYVPETSGSAAVLVTESATTSVAISVPTSVPKSDSIELPVSYLCQYPELPTGCEITSLTTVLNYLGYPVSKETMSDEYLPKSEETTGDYMNYFLGNPRDEHAFGCFASPIVKAANAYLEEQDSQLKAYNYSGYAFDTLLNEINAGSPVIIWSTVNLVMPYVTLEWDIDGKSVEWLSPEHCVVLIGYDLNTKSVTISDPEKGIIQCSMSVIETLYEKMSSQAVVVK